MYSLPISQKIRYQLRHIIANRYQRQDAKEPFRLPRHVFPEPWLISLAVLLLILLVFVLHIVFDQNQIRLRYPNIFPVVLLNFFILVFRIYVKGNWHWIHIKTLAWLKTAAFVLRESLSRVCNRSCLIILCHFLKSSLKTSFDCFLFC